MRYRFPPPLLAIEKGYPHSSPPSFGYDVAHDSNSQDKVHDDLVKYRGWCEYNCKSDWAIQTVGVTHRCNEISSSSYGKTESKAVVKRIDSVSIHFASERDYVLFKMFHDDH